MKPKLELTFKESYGNKRYYPNCGASKIIVLLMKCKTFTQDQVNTLKSEFDIIVQE